MTTELAKIGDKGIEIRDTNDLAVAVNMIVQSGLCPKQYIGKPKDAMIAILAGRQVGWGPIQSLQYIAVINGRPSMYGDGPTGLALASGKVEAIYEWWECDGRVVDEPNYTTLKGYPDSLTACWKTKRKDHADPSKVARFSVSDAKMAGLWGKQGPWTTYPKRMLVCRARAWGLRDNYADALQGISQAEEWEDMVPHRGLDPLEAQPEPITVEAEPVAPAVIETPEADRTATREDKSALLDAVAAHLAEKVPAGSKALDALSLIKAAIQYQYERDTLNTMGELAAVRDDILAGKYDLETGDRFPD